MAGQGSERPDSPPRARYGMDKVRPPRDAPAAVDLYRTILRMCHCSVLRALAVGKRPGFRFRASSLCSMQ